MDRLFNVQIARFHLEHRDCYVLQGICEGDEITGKNIFAYMDRERLPVKVTDLSGIEVRKKYLAKGLEIDREYFIWIKLPKEIGSYKKLSVFQKVEEEQKQIYRLPASNLLKQQKEVNFCIDAISEGSGGKMSVSGWAASKEPYQIQVQDKKGAKIEAEIKFHQRVDLAGNFPEGHLCSQAGFQLEYQKPASSKVQITVSACGLQSGYTVGSSAAGKAGQPSYFTKGMAYLKRNGLERAIKRTIEKVMRVDLHIEENYGKWRKKHLISREELEAQRRTKFELRPLISIVVPLYKTPIPYLKEFVESVQNQTYENFELCLSDGSGEDSPLTETLNEIQKKDTRIKVIYTKRQMQISENTNCAIQIATGNYIAFADHDDLLAPNALFECVKAINENSRIDVLYTDEDKITMNGKEYFQPHFKSDFNIDLLCSMNYISHLFVVKKELLKQVGCLRQEFDGAQDYDFILRCVEQAKEICHIPKALYHWRAHKDSTAENPESKLYAFEAGKRAVQAHYDRIGIEAVVTNGEYLGLYKTRFVIPDEKPLISIIIPNKDHSADLDKCVQSILTKSAYPNIEFIIVENNSTEKETFDYYRRLEAEHECVHVVFWEDVFNYSGINNFGVRHAKGEYLLFLNNDTEIINRDCLEEMLGYCIQDDVGAVGARLYFEDNTIQHAGVIIGFGGIAGHAFIGSLREDNGYFSRIICAADLSAVTAACMMVKRSVFEEAGGFDESLQVAFNDIDFCLKVRALGKLVVYNPYAELYHYESKSRGYEDTPDKVQRFNREANVFLRKWPDILEKGDPYYNVNLSLDKADFSLKV